ncbi:MAG TPA: hypothetical protein VGK74_19110 [Symbiobacteriaceae bacterium]
MMNAQAEEIKRTEMLAATGGIQPLATTVGTAVKRAFLVLTGWVNKALFSPSPKAAARHGLDVWAGIEHVDHYEAYRLQAMRGVPR